jgi:hypothetical protein
MGKLLITDNSGKIFYQKEAIASFDATTTDADEHAYDDQTIPEVYLKRCYESEGCRGRI